MTNPPESNTLPASERKGGGDLGRFASVTCGDARCGDGGGPPPVSPPSRRDLLRTAAAGFGNLALTSLLADAAYAQSPRAGEAPTAGEAGVATTGETALPVAGGPLTPRETHYPARARRVIFLFMHGGPSQVDTFDHKPLLTRDHGKPLPFALPRVVSSQTGNLLASPWRFRRHGASGLWMSEVFPHLARRADDLCMLNGMHGSNSRHGGALLELHTGSDTSVRPSLGSWITYGLGTENQDLPGFLTLCPTLTHGGVNNFSSAFLPAVYQGTPLGNASVPAEQAVIPFMETRGAPAARQRRELDLIQQMNAEQLAAAGPDAALEGRIQSFELAFRMQAAAPQLQDLGAETAETRALYGLDSPSTANFGRQCLLARRFVEQGVRFVQVTHSYKWDQHSDLRRDLAKNALEVDQPIAALLTDLKRRGLWEDTLVLWGGEFGRTPVAQGTDGRDHNPQGFTMWLAGGGVKAGIRHGATDEYGYYAVENKVHFHDLHATLLHLLGLDHERLTYRHAGRDFRLTDVHGQVVREILA